jgi:urease accessory protein
MNTLLNTISQSRRLLGMSKSYAVRWFVFIAGLLLTGVFAGLNWLTDMSGWTSGFTHPLHGGDHFLTMLAVGIWAAQLRGSAIWLLPITFVSVMSLGSLAGAAGLFIPIAELLILLSCLVFSVLIVRRVRFSRQINVAIVAFFAFFHGFAHGQEISTSASLISYTLGFMVATLLLHGAGILLVKLLIVVFALLISHLVYAQSASSLRFDAATLQLQTDKTYQLFIESDAAPPDRWHERQQLDGSGGGTIQSIAVVQHQPAISQSDGLASLVARIVQPFSTELASYTARADLLISPQLGVHFLTNGVGLTSPPAALLFDSHALCVVAAVCYFPAVLGILVLTTRYLNLCCYSPAIGLLSNGVGATSPPVYRLVVASLFISAVSKHTLFLSCFLHSRTLHQSRSPPNQYLNALFGLRLLPNPNYKL